ncbi:sugar phosphate isomerase/epimerase [bacterium]|nr:sugar phosphate isomerase/epimerase [bacterium]
MYQLGCKVDETRVDGNLSAVEKDLQTFKEWGFQVVELPVHGLDVIVNGKIQQNKMQQVLDLLVDFSFQYSVHAPNPINLMDQADPEIHFQVLDSTLQFARKIKSNVVVYHAGRYIAEEWFPYSNQDQLNDDLILLMLQQEITYIRKLADKYPDVMICIENARPYTFYSPYCYAENIDSLLNLLETINRRNVKMTLDIGHLFMAANFFGYDPIEAINKAKPFIQHIHIHDNFGKSILFTEKQQTHLLPFGKGDMHLPVGFGSIPFSDFLPDCLSHYDQFIIMEIRSRYFQDIEESRKNLCAILQKNLKDKE